MEQMKTMIKANELKTGLKKISILKADTVKLNVVENILSLSTMSIKNNSIVISYDISIDNDNEKRYFSCVINLKKLYNFIKNSNKNDSITIKKDNNMISISNSNSKITIEKEIDDLEFYSNLNQELLLNINGSDLIDIYKKTNKTIFKNNEREQLEYVNFKVNDNKLLVNALNGFAAFRYTYSIHSFKNSNFNIHEKNLKLLSKILSKDHVSISQTDECLFFNQNRLHINIVKEQEKEIYMTDTIKKFFENVQYYFNVDKKELITALKQANEFVFDSGSYCITIDTGGSLKSINQDDELITYFTDFNNTEIDNIQVNGIVFLSMIEQLDNDMVILKLGKDKKNTPIIINDQFLIMPLRSR